MATIIVGGIVAILVVVAAVKVFLDKKNGKSCSGNCAGCSGCAGHHDE